MSLLNRRTLLASLVLVAVRPALSAAQQPAPMTIVVYEPGPRWKPGRPVAEQDLGPHLAYVAKLFKDGPVVAYGPDAGGSGRGYYILSGGDASVARDFIDRDPGVKAGVVNAAERHVVGALINALAAQDGSAPFSILRMQPGPNWTPGKTLAEQDIKEHFAYMVAQAKAGVVVLAAPDSSGQEGWYVLRGGQDAADRLLADDPGARSGVLRPLRLGWSVIGMRPAK